MENKHNTNGAAPGKVAHNSKTKQRQQRDEALFNGAFYELAGAIMDKSERSALWEDDTLQARDAIISVLDYYRIDIANGAEPSGNWKTQLKTCLRESRLSTRVVRLKDQWYQQAIGPMLGNIRKSAKAKADGGKDQEYLVALIPKGLHYEWYDYTDKHWKRVTAHNAWQFGPTAIHFYEPLGSDRVDLKGLLRFMIRQPSSFDYTLMVGVSLLTTLIGMLLPYLTQYLFSAVVPQGKISLLLPVAVLILGSVLANVLLGINKQLSQGRLQTKIKTAVEAAGMMRVLSMPADFFREYAAGELNQRLSQITSLCTTIISIITVGGLSALFSLLYFFELFAFAPALSWVAIAILLGSLILTLVATLWQQRLSQKIYSLNARLSGWVLAMIGGISKIKLAGAEKRAFAKWASSYKEVASLSYNPPFLLKIQEVLPTLISAIGFIAIYFIAAASNVSTADYMGFNSAYGLVSGAIGTLASMAKQISTLKPAWDMAEPILQTVPETSGTQGKIPKLTGQITASHLCFRYLDKGDLVLRDLSLSIAPGEYVGIVGQTGSGKSTLMRILLGFETPISGAVFFDDREIRHLDLKALRRQIGTVMQNGQLIAGSILSNITLSAPWLKVEDAWRAAETAGIADDIRDMPMGMQTMVSEGNGGLSGGQCQRILIARAIAPNPRVLMFDEATSALDNVTQGHIANALGAVRCTRIVIAHRLSTVKNCDRILVMDRGQMVESGNYDSLVAQKGVFYELVKRQQL